MASGVYCWLTTPLRKHLKRHEKPYGCTQCQKRFGSKNDWKRHENSQHFQHEIWKCEEKLNTPLSDTCNKVCHRRETFKQHLVSHHGIDSQRLEDKLDRCRIGRLGEARFWCGFCKDVIELETEKNAHDACNARYNHIDDHYSGRNGAVKREAGEWQFGDSDAAEAETKVPPQGDEAKEEMAALPQVSEPRKRSRHGSGPTPKRARFSPPREDIMWYCVCYPPLFLLSLHAGTDDPRSVNATTRGALPTIRAVSAVRDTCGVVTAEWKRSNPRRLDHLGTLNS